MEDNKKDKRLENILISSHESDSLFSDVYIEHNSFPEMEFNEINTEVEFFGKEIPFPIMINAITGGTEQGVEINEMLYYIAQELRIPMEVGNQDMLLEDRTCAELFLGETNYKDRKTIVISNLHSASNPDQIKLCVSAIEADGIALHINPAQEIVGEDGRRDFRNILENITELVKIYGDKLIVKEIGSGMSEKTIQSLVDCGVQYIDVSGAGGSNLIEIEDLRNLERDFSDLYDWGIPTAKSLINARRVSKDVKLIASGGIKNAMDLVKALILGADYVAVGGELLKYLLHGGPEYAKNYLEELMYKAKVLMFLLGAKDIESLKNTPYKLTGRLKEIVE